MGLCPDPCSLHLCQRDPFAMHRQHMNRMLSGSFGFGPLLGITDGTTPGARQAGRRMQVTQALSAAQNLSHSPQSLSPTLPGLGTPLSSTQVVLSLPKSLRQWCSGPSLSSTCIEVLNATVF